MLSSNTGIQNLILNIEYSKPNFIRMRDIFTRFMRVLLKFDVVCCFFFESWGIKFYYLD